MFSSPSPRTASYERLENGMGSKGGSGRKRFAWKKFAIGAAVILGVVYVFGPRKADLLGDFPSYSSDGDITGPDFQEPPSPQPPHPPVTPGASDDSHIPSQGTERPAPKSPADDPDLTKTVFCKSAYGSKPLVQWALMIDAGSTGSRIHIYKFNNCGSSPAYEYEVFKMINPGLSASKFRGNPGAAAESLDSLLDEAVRVVPESLRKCTPVAVKATAGLRALGPAESEGILQAVRSRLADKYPFPLHDEDGQGVAIMDGKDEGVYAWITANYLLNTISPSTSAATQPYAVLDLGGGSTQIVFEPTFDKSKPDIGLAEGEHKYDLDFGGRKFVLYQHSYLGYGLMAARSHIHRLVDFMATFRPQGAPVVANPCLAQGTTRQVEVEDERAQVKWNVTMSGEDVGSFEACNRIVELVMAKDAVCSTKPCSFDGVYQPSLMETFPSGKILLLSYFYDRLEPLLPKSSSGPSPISISTIAQFAQDVCQGKAAWEQRWGSDETAMAELKDRPEYCLDLTFMHALLRLGYEFGPDRMVTLGKRIDGTELGWCLGATLAMVGGDLRCRV